ncbi:hypothetical protein Sango_0947300 [Sesamum angolense]|uniref:Uncharacterized protein n=1 Tax=Sesamum angolense TaxID=2727404 RepID=A0AAE2BY61_9LAMI|nr:hypothetical protein Sango_0947300 [Sesamum angolense]
MWWAVPCRDKKSLIRTESRMDVEEILKMKLETIMEEPEIDDENGDVTMRRSISKKVKLKVKMGKLFISQLSLQESYVIFMAGFASRGGLSGLPRY